MGQQSIYNQLKKEFKNDYGVCGLMGNLKAESGLRSNNLQNKYNEILRKTDEQYTEEVDNGTYKDFATDRAGYGLAQWTTKGRKQGLYDYIKSKNKSIADEQSQVEWCIYELKVVFKEVYEGLKTAKSVKEASDLVLTQYEKPKNQSEANKERRAKIGEELYEELVGGDPNGGQNGVVKSPLTDLVMLSSYIYGRRTHAIDRISPHCYVGQVTIERIGKGFQSRPVGKEASCNYGIGLDGKVVLVVDERDASCCTSSKSNDERAIAIECASDNKDPYAFNTAVYNKLVDLCVDICKRYGKNTLLWIADKNAALSYTPRSNEMLLTVHRWFAAKACPGAWMFSRMDELASTVTKRLGGVEPTPVPIDPYRVRISIDNLNIRTGPGTNFAKTGKATGRGVFTIIEESSGEGSVKGWGKLKSGAGWISLDYVTRL